MKMNVLSVLILLICLCAGNIFAQKTSNQCENYGNKDFYGEDINLNLVNAELKDILNLITEKFGCNFVVDKSVGKIDVAVKIERVPWNIALDAILRSQDLSIEINRSFFRVKKYEDTFRGCGEVNLITESTPLYTEFVKVELPSKKKLNYLKDLQKLLSRYLTQRGQIEIDEKTNTLIVTETRKNLDKIIHYIRLAEILDKEELPKN